MELPNSNFEEGEPDFVRLLREIQAGRASHDLLFEHPLFQSRLRLLAMNHASTTQDAEDLANNVRVKVWQHLKQFRPADTKPYGNFFAWLRALTRNVYVDSLRKSKVKFDELQPEDLTIADTQNDPETSLLYKEVMAEFEKRIYALPAKERLAMAYYLEGFSYREISAKLLEAGFSISHVTIHNRIRKGLRAFFIKSGVEDVRSKNVKVTRVRATRAKREFHSIVEQAINSSAPVIPSEHIYPNSYTVVGQRNLSKATASKSRPGWASANDLLKRMQSPESKQGIQAAFDASPEELGEAAVEDANTKHKVPVGSLTTFLMATSTANVVGRVMNLTKDVA